MLQNGSEMYDLSLGENAARYFNGHSKVAAGMAQKKDKIRKGKMVPNKNELPSFSSNSLCTDGKLKFSDRLKALLKTGATPSDNGMEPEDPYTFREPEPQQVLGLYQNNNTSLNISMSNRLSVCQDTSENSNSSVDSTVSTKSPINNINSTQLGLYPTLSASLGHCIPVGLTTGPMLNATKQVSKADEESSKTMNRLQAKIARNKVIGKHKRVSPSSRSLNLPPYMVKQIAPQPVWHPKKERSLLEEQLLGIKSDLVVKKEPEEIVPKSYKPPQQHCLPHSVMAIPPKRRRSIMPSRQNATPCHEALQRIGVAQEAVRDIHQDLFPLGLEMSESEASDDESKGVFQRHWFSGWQEQSDYSSRAAQAHTDIRRKLAQLTRGVAKPRESVQITFDSSLLEAAQRYPSQSAVFLRSQTKQGQIRIKHNKAKMTMLAKRTCSFQKGENDACLSTALPCTQHCLRHIMYNVDQLLFQHCTAKFSDNTQCCMPVFDICHELPLCLEHARKMDNYDKMCAETKPKKIRKKPKPSAMTRPNKRGKKKRRVQRSADIMHTHREAAKPLKVERGTNRDMDVLMDESSYSSKSYDMYIKEEVVVESFATQEMQVLMKDDHPVVENVEEVLAMEDIPLDPVELATQASRLLEEHDLTNVLNQIPADAFNDLFTEDKNGEYEPTREETEELERALEAVDKDVKSLEKLSQTQGLLETLMDDHTLVHTLGHLPEVPALTVPGDQLQLKQNNAWCDSRGEEIDLLSWPNSFRYNQQDIYPSLDPTTSFLSILCCSDNTT